MEPNNIASFLSKSLDDEISSVGLCSPTGFGGLIRPGGGSGAPGIIAVSCGGGEFSSVIYGGEGGSSMHSIDIEDAGRSWKVEFD